jgi:Holliday junction resolvase
MGANSKTKGKTFERDIANYLSKLYDSSFTRVPDSGAFTGGKNAVRKQTLSENQIRARKGDIIPPDEWKFFNCEAKSYADFPFHHLLINKSIPLLEEWIEQTLQAADDGDCNIIAMKFNRKGKFLAFRLPETFKTNRHIDYTDKQGNNWRLTSFDEFFDLNKDTFKARCMSPAT